MEFNNVDNAGALFISMSRAQLEPYHFAADTGFPSYPVNFLRAPETINELLLYTERHGLAVWMPNATLVLVDNEPENDNVYFQMGFSFNVGYLSVYIKGDSVHEILNTALFFATLKVDEANELGEVIIWCHSSLTFNDSHDEQLASLLDAFPTKKITFTEGAISNRGLSAAIASRPYPINLQLWRASINLGIFLDHLQHRTTPFGSLSFLMDTDVQEHDLRQLIQLERLDVLFEHLKFNKLPGDLLLKLLSAPTKSIEFTVGVENEEIDLSTAAIVPKQIDISLSSFNVLPTGFMLSFLKRVAQLGHLEVLSLNFWGGNALSEEIKQALRDALTSNKKMYELIVYHRWDLVLGSYVNDLFDVLADHEGLLYLHLEDYSDQIDPDYAGLKRLLKRNRRLDVSTRDQSWKLDPDVIEIYAKRRFYFESESLCKEPESIRSSLVGTALTPYAACFVRHGILWSQHTDLLCGLLQARETASTEGAEVDMMEVDEEI